MSLAISPGTVSVAENENGQEKTEEATPKRLASAREEGQSPRSKDLNTTFILIGGVVGLIMMGSQISDQLKGMMRANFSLPREAAFDTGIMLLHLGATTVAAVQALTPFLILVLVAALLGPVSLGGWVFSIKALQPKLSKMDPIQGLKRMFEMTALVEFFKTIAKFTFVTSIAIYMMVGYQSEILSLSTASLEPALDNLFDIVGWTVLVVSASMIIISLIDVPFQLFDHGKKMRMTRQEVKDELKDTEGKPEVKGRIRQLQREFAQRRMMEAIPDADVVITNPEHFAVALKYDVDSSGAPLLVAKGVDLVALKIRQIANAHGVLVMESPPLARAVYFTTELDREIPSNLYMAVAQVLAYVFQLKAYRQGQGRKPKELADIAIPKEARYRTNGKLAEETE